MTDSLGNLDDRVESRVFVKPIVYGSVSRRLEPSDEISPHTHRWTVYLRPYRDEDMSLYVRKVVFKLHESFAETSRCLTEPPYEVTETGWGEFETVIKIFFRCPKEKPVVLRHNLRLFSGTGLFNSEPDQAIVSEFHDEIVFRSPTQLMTQILLAQDPDRPLLPHAKNYEHEKVEKLNAILQAKEQIKNEITVIKSEIRKMEAEKRKMEGKLGRVGFHGN